MKPVHPAVRSAAERRLAAAFIGLSVTMSGCAGRQPSQVPLGFGPIAANMRTDPAPVKKATKEHDDSTSETTVTATEDDDDSDKTKTPAPEEKKKEEVAAKDDHPAKAEPPSPAVTAAAFVGKYAGEDVSTYRLEGLPDRADRDPNAKINAKSDGDRSADFVLIDSSNGKEICTLTSTTKGNAATIAPGQKCFEQDEGEETASATVKSGSVTVDQAKLTMDVAFDFKMSVGDRDFAGTLDYHFEGARK